MPGIGEKFTIQSRGARRASLALLAAVLALPPLARAQLSFTETFTGTTATGWNFGGLGTSAAPVLTANTVDTAGTGWLRMTGSTNNQATYALWDNAVFSVNAQIQIEMEYTFWNGHDIGGAQNGVGADGLTFFLLDAAVDSASFQPGSYGGSLGYAALDTDGNGSVNSAGMAGGYLGFGFDNWGNYSGQTEGRDGGLGTSLANGTTTGYPNRIAVRGPDDGDGNNATGWEFIKASAPLETLGGGGQMDFPTSTVRPLQTGADYRKFRLTLDANNQLTVEMKFGASASYITAFTADLSGYDRPEYFKIGFTAGTGGANETHEIRNVSVTMTPWQPDSFEWSDAGGGDGWATAGNWVGNVVPSANADILFGDAPATGSSQPVQLDSDRQLNSLTFDSPYNYSINGTNTITLGNTGTVGLPSINVNDYNDAYGRHKINVPLSVAENLKVNNYSFSTLCINGAVGLGTRTLTTTGYGATNLNGQITGSGAVSIDGSTIEGTGSGIVTIAGDNGASYTGAIAVNGGQLVVLHNNALGTTSTRTTVNDGGTLTFRGGISTAELLTLNGSGTTLGRGELGGALYNDGGTNTLSGNITLGSNAAVRSRDGELILSGVISDGTGTYSLTKLGDGVVTLSGANTYNGNTVVREGVLRVNHAGTNGSSSGLPGGYSTTDTTSNFGALNLAGGVVELSSATTFTRSVGTGEEQVFWSGDGGFSAYGGGRTVTLGSTLTWGSGSFVPTGSALILGSAYADNTLTFTNAIGLGAAAREIRVIDGANNANAAGAVDGLLSGVLSSTGSSGGIRKTGDGTLSLTGNNTYDGAIEIAGGALRITEAADLSASTNVVLNGGVLEIAGDLNGTGTAGDYSASLGAANGNIGWTGNGGFAASGAARTVRLGNGTGQVTWGSGSFIGASSTLIFGATSADSTVTLANDLALGSGSRTIKTVQGNAAGVASGALSGVVSGAAGLSVTGNGRLDLTAANTNTGTLAVIGSEVRLGGSGAMASATGYTIQQGGTLTLDNTSANNTDRVSSSAVSLAGGTISFLGQTGNVDSTETMGALTLSSGANTVNVARGDATGSATLTFASLARTAGATLDVTNPAGTLGTTGDQPRLVVTSAPTLDDGILPYATVNGSNFATNSTVDGATPDGISAYAGSLAGDQSTWTATTVNAAPSSAVTAAAALGSNRTINSLKLSSGIDVAQAGFTLTLQSGGLLTTGSTAVTLSGGSLTTGNSNDLIVHAYNTGGTTISSTLTGSGGLTKSGTGTLTLSGTSANTLTGTTTVNAGTLVLDKSDNVTALAGNLVVGDGRGIDTVRLDSNEQIADTAAVSLVGGEAGNAANVARFELNGALSTSDPARIEHIGTLNVLGNSVLDFSGGTTCSPTEFYIDVLNAQSGSLLTIENWIEFTDFLLVKKTSLDTTGEQAQMARVVFDGYGGSASWKDYSTDYYQIVPYSPVPEPSTYGILALGGLGSFAVWRRRRRAT